MLGVALRAEKKEIKDKNPLNFGAETLKMSEYDFMISN